MKHFVGRHHLQQFAAEIGEPDGGDQIWMILLYIVTTEILLMSDIR